MSRRARCAPSIPTAKKSEWSSLAQEVPVSSVKPYHNCGGISRIPLPYASCNQRFGVWLLVLVFFCVASMFEWLSVMMHFNLGRSVAKSTLYSRWNTLRTSATKAVSRSFLARIVLRWIDSTCGKRCLC